MKQLGTPIALVATLAFGLACEEEKPKAAPAPTPSAAVMPAVPTPAPVPEPAPPPAAAKQRPKVELELTDARRSAVESKYPEAKGFLAAKELEQKLQKNKAIKAKEGALTAFDKDAKGKWVLFAGQMVNLTDKGFDVGVVYTPLMPGDVMGMSRQFFEVTLSDVEGYDKGQFKAGDMVVVLAKYQGGGKAGSGRELVANEVWK